MRTQSSKNEIALPLAPLERHPESFDATYFGTLGELRTVANRAAEPILMVACADHGTAPGHLSIADPDRLLVVQNMAASIPPAGPGRHSTTVASIEYALGVEKAQHVIVCGHLNCGIISRWAATRAKFNDDSARSGTSHPSGADPRDCRRSRRRPPERTIREHILQQVINLQSHEFVRVRLNSGRLRLHAWIVDDATARVETYRPCCRHFRRVGIDCH